MPFWHRNALPDPDDERLLRDVLTDTRHENADVHTHVADTERPPPGHDVGFVFVDEDTDEHRPDVETAKEWG